MYKLSAETLTDEYILDEGLIFKGDNIHFSSWGKYDESEIEGPTVIGDGWYDIGSIGGFCTINFSSRRCVTNECHIDAESIGRFTMIGNAVNIGFPQHQTDFISPHLIFRFGRNQEYFEKYLPDERDYKYESDMRKEYNKCVKPWAVIGNDCWIGSNVSIMNGVHVGDGAVIGTGAVVTGDVEPYSIVGGVPAKPIKYRFDSKTIRRLLKLKWWEYGPQVLYGLNLADSNDSTLKLEERIMSGRYKKLELKKITVDAREHCIRA